MSSKASELVLALAKGNASAAQEAFESAMNEKVNEVLDSRKIAIAGKIYESTEKHTIEAHGVKGNNSTKWRKTFKNHEHLNSWAEKNNAEVHATRNLDDK